MFKTKIYFFLLNFLLVLASCGTENRAGVESEKVYQDYKAFVMQVEQDTVISETDLGAHWNSRTDSLNKLVEVHKSRIAAHLDDYGAERREEVNAFNERLRVAFEERQKIYDAISRRYELRQELMGMEVAQDEMSRITAENIAPTYEHFVTTLHNNKENYNPADWQLITGWWSALENRMRAVSTEINPKDRENILKNQRAYLALRKELTTQNSTEV